MALHISAHAENYTWFPEETVYLDASHSKEYSQQIFWYSETPGEEYNGALPAEWAYNDFDFSYSVLSGDLAVTSLGYDRQSNGLKVTFTGNKGSIEITASNFGKKDGNTYICKYVLYYANAKRWDFNTKPFSPQAVWWGTETHMNNLSNHPVYTPYNGSIDESRNPGELISQADGLRFVADAGCLGYNNPAANHTVKNKKGVEVTDRTKDANCETRYICLKAGSKVIIPHSIFQNYSHPRVRIKMNRDGVKNNTLQMIINNAKDAVGTPCDQEHGWYGIGGCTWWGQDKGDYLYRGEYHFQIVDKSTDFSMEFPSWNEDNSTAWLMLYTIEVYDSEEMITENSILGDSYQFLTTKYTNENGDVVRDALTSPGNFYVHYRGKAEKSYLTNCTVSGTVGTLGDKTGDNFIQRFVSDGGNDTKHKYTPVKNEFGTFRMRLDVHDHNNNYVTDYAYRTQSVGLMENKTYPYTWDFTDIKPYQNSNFRDDKLVETLGTNKMQVESTMGYAQQPQNDYVTGVTYIPRNLWDENGGLRVGHDAGHNVMYCGGSQLWYGTTIIPETAGLAFEPVNYDASYNGAMSITDNGLKFDQDIRDWWLWRVMIPQVDNQCVIYVRAKKLRDNSYYNVGYYYGDANNKTEKSRFSTESLSSTKQAREIAVDGDEVVYAIPSPSSTSNVTLFFTGVEVHKIAVSKDPKKVNKYGWATESRNHVIDQSLTSYFTGKPFEACAVTEVNYDKHTVTLDRVNMDKKVMKLADNESGAYNAYIIHNKSEEGGIDEKTVDILATGDGFHLFVPDIHDYLKDNEKYPAEGEGNRYNMKSTYGHQQTMKAQLAAGTVPAKEGEYTNFVLTWQIADIEDNTQGETYDFGYVGFFRVQDSGVTSRGNQGYLPLALGSGNSVNKFNLVFAGETEDGITMPTAIEPQTPRNNVYYNLNGQKIDGVPTIPGIYIVNGKKTVVK